MAQVFNGRLLKVFVQEMRYPNGYKGKVEFIKHPGAVLIVPVFDDGRFLMIRQFRAVIKKYIWEFPAGTLEPGEPLEKCVQRELIEETGYSCRNIQKLGYIYLAPGYSTEKIAIFKVTGLTACPKQAMPDEVIVEKIFTLKQVKHLVSCRKIVDAKSLAALALLKF